MIDSRGPADLTAHRVAAKTYTVRNHAGAELRIGMHGSPDAFSPVELLQAAVAGCAALSAEAQLATTLGDAFAASVTVAGVHDPGDNRLTRLVATLEADMAELDAAARERLVARAERFIGSLCTVKRTLAHGVETTTEVHDRT